MNGSDTTSKDSNGPGALIADHLRQEEALLAAALPVVRALQEAFSQPGKTAFMPVLDRQQEFFKLVGEVNQKRQRFREDLARHLRIAPNEVTLQRALACLPNSDRTHCANAAERVRQLAHELAEANYWISIHLRIHLGAYRRILRDLTNTSAGSGRYGPAGKTESLDYRPLLLIHG